jgi:hypothetical protein
MKWEFAGSLEKVSEHGVDRGIPEILKMMLVCIRGSPREMSNLAGKKNPPPCLGEKDP